MVKLTTLSSEVFLERLRRVHGDPEQPVSVGVSSVCEGEAAFADGFAEAQQALLGSVVLKGKPSVLAYEELGAYKYLLRVAVDGGVRDATVDAVSKLAEYDAQRGAQLVATLEEFLRRHGSISATRRRSRPSEHASPRLRRIGELSGLDLRRDDWLLIEIAVKMVKLQQAPERRKLSSAQPNPLARTSRRFVLRGRKCVPPAASEIHILAPRRCGSHTFIRLSEGGRAMAPTSEGGTDGWDRNRRFGLEGHAEARCRVRVRTVRRHVRAAERKLVPVGSREAFDGLLAEGAGFAGFAAGRSARCRAIPTSRRFPT